MLDREGKEDLGAAGSVDSEKLGIVSDRVAADAFGVVEPSGSSMGGGWIMGGGGGGIMAASCRRLDSGCEGCLAIPFDEGVGVLFECPFSCILGAVLLGVCSGGGESAIVPRGKRHWNRRCANQPGGRMST